MDYIKKIAVVLLSAVLCGCATVSEQYKAGYRKGAQENIQTFAANYYGNDFPYFNWSAPQIQIVSVPAHIENGVFIPENSIPVMIEPGEWRSQYGYPISTQNQGGKDVKDNTVIEGYRVEYSNFDITALPRNYSSANGK
ncbi:MAG TPA: hypothetical protein DCL49_04515 [Candidatus Omnitrophica bacterium]|nr:hypothetical protein [Candidatus Omnitrophota bacterium]